MPVKKGFLLIVVSILCFLIVQLGFVRVSNAQSANNAKNDFGGVNHGDFIALVWNDAEGAAQYYVYTSTSLAGPWTPSFSVGDNSGGAKVDYTPDARLRDVCYKVEATDASGFVIRIYEPICVPKYEG
jgi:hypothetical protein